jgi:hypothetical protein
MIFNEVKDSILHKVGETESLHDSFRCLHRERFVVIKMNSLFLILGIGILFANIVEEGSTI